MNRKPTERPQEKAAEQVIETSAAEVTSGAEAAA